MKEMNDIRTLLNTMCGVKSTSTGKLCTKTLNCPQHNDEQREQIRFELLGQRINISSLRGKCEFRRV